MRREWVMPVVSLVVSLAALLSAPAVAGESYDPAYVDSAQSKALPDPARADASTASPAQAQVQAQYAQGQHATQLQARTEHQIAAQMEKFTAAHVAALNQSQPGNTATAGAAYVDPPVGGRDLVGELSAGGIPMRTRPPMAPETQAPPARQLGSALLQDAAGVVDSGIQREIQGPGGRIVLPQPPASPDQSPGW